MFVRIKIPIFITHNKAGNLYCFCILEKFIIFSYIIKILRIIIYEREIKYFYKELGSFSTSNNLKSKKILPDIKEIITKKSLYKREENRVFRNILKFL